MNKKQDSFNFLLKRIGEEIKRKPDIKEIRSAFYSLNLVSKIIFLFFLTIGLISGLLAIWQINESMVVEVASNSGNITEGIIGSPRFINPLLAVSEADWDLTSLIYSGLMKVNEEGNLIPDLAESYQISEDGREYLFKLKPDLKWHDNKPLTTSDIEFTIKKIQDPLTKSPRRSSWEGVEVRRVDDLTIIFTLKQPFANFIENTTLGIIPQHLWSDISADNFPFSDLNTNPIGSGPYEIKKIKKDSSGIPLYYDLKPFRNYSLGQPFLTIQIRLYPNEISLIEAYQKKEINSLSAITPKTLAEINNQESKVNLAILPRVFALFFNQNQASILSNKEIRNALDLSINKENLINQSLSGYGLPLDKPFINKDMNIKTTEPNAINRITEAENILNKAGWQKDEDGWMKKEDDFIELNIATSDVPELKQIAEIVSDTWNNLGIKTSISIFDTSNLNQTVIRPRKYDVLLFGTIIGREQDLYPFWHSSQRLDPGLNIASYANITVDSILQELRTEIDKQTKMEKTKEVAEIISQDKPASFLYSPYFIYLTPKNLINVKFNILNHNSERFSNVHNWYINTEKVWRFFASERSIIKN